MIDLREKYWPLLVVVAVTAFWLGRNDFFMFADGEAEEKILSQEWSGERSEVDQKPEELITIHIAGEVENPGVYRLPSESRIVDAILAAGGESSGSNLNEVNLARIITDGEQILIPGISPSAAVQQNFDGGQEERFQGVLKTGEAASSSAQEAAGININSADSEKLATLPGIGAVRADEIISYRIETGGFSSVEELIHVPGIGQVTLDNVRDLVTVY